MKKSGLMLKRIACCVGGLIIAALGFYLCFRFCSNASLLIFGACMIGGSFLFIAGSTKFQYADYKTNDSKRCK